ncbi:alpha/beta hydrolase [Actinoplanes sp. Pm04-4]|uniref:Alpha/beta hydrolase n=1 Tax=Paractinoplanes pyxinae TaxID=2997416 RepID=A0ABT4AWQ8_9ACTN|nr:alpha/beta hydrolase [Actinoplanes pyxinae]MCY1137865.1 alpha/beta hydrolase [Actinoplanes pyxinae]
MRTPPWAPAEASRPSCASPPAGVRRWWSALPVDERNWLLATEAPWLARLDGLPAADRDIANRLLLDDRRTELDRAIAAASGRERGRLRKVRDGLAALSDRLADEDGPRAYLLSLDTGEEGRAVVALGDPDRASSVLTHVPGMTADLASFGGELARAERVAVRAAELDPRSPTSAILWLDYDAPDFVDEAAGARRAEAATPALRHFQEGLRAAHEGSPARQVVLGHSYGSLVVGRAAATDGFEADGVVFVGSPGVGVDSARDLRVPAGEVWSTTSRSDVIQYAAVAPGGFVRDMAVASGVPVAGPWLAFGRPERDLWFGHNPSDPGFGGHVFASSPGSGHIGYWEPGTPSLDTMAAITLGSAR